MLLLSTSFVMWTQWLNCYNSNNINLPNLQCQIIYSTCFHLSTQSLVKSHRALTGALKQSLCDLPEQGRSWESRLTESQSPGWPGQPVGSPGAGTSGIPSAEHWAKPLHSLLLWQDAPAPQSRLPAMIQPEYGHKSRDVYGMIYKLESQIIIVHMQSIICRYPSLHYAD